jgi:hypothetical protein
VLLADERRIDEEILLLAEDPADEYSEDACDCVDDCLEPCEPLEPPLLPFPQGATGSVSATHWHVKGLMVHVWNTCGMPSGQ